MTYDAKLYASNVAQRIAWGGEDIVALVEGAIRGAYDVGRAERPALHPTTIALLAATKAWWAGAKDDGEEERGAMFAARAAWLAAGCPDADGEP